MASAQAQFSTESANRKLVLAGQLAFLPTGVLTTLLGPTLPIVIARWALNDTQAGNLFLVQFFAQLAGVQLASIMVARMGFRPAFQSGLALMGCGVSTFFLGSAWLGFTSVAVYGLGVGFITPTDNLLIAEVSPHAKSSAVSLLNFFWGVGAVLCSLLVAWSNAHAVLPIFLGLVAFSIFLLLAAVRSLPFPGAVKSDSTPIAWRQIWTSPATWLFAAVFFFYPGTETAVGGWIGSYVSRMGGLSGWIDSVLSRIGVHESSIPSMMPAFFWAALTFGRGSGSLFLRLLPERRVLQVGFALGSAGIGLLLWSSTVPGVIASALLTGLSFATLYPITVARLSHHYGIAARSIGSLMFSLAAVGPAMIPWLVGVISHATGNLRAGLLVPLLATVALFVIHLPDW